jgi:hypothetical protein
MDIFFAIKEITTFKIPSICKGCETTQCSENFYGIRLEKHPKDEKYYVMLCVDTLSSTTYMSVQDFLHSPQCADIIASYHQ